MTKGCARLYVFDDVIEYSGIKIEKPKAGQLSWGKTEVKELFDLWQSFLLLPEGYTIIGVFFDVPAYHWVIVVESEAIPQTEYGAMLPRIWCTYEYGEDSKVRLLNLEVKL